MQRNRLLRTAIAQLRICGSGLVEGTAVANGAVSADAARMHHLAAAHMPAVAPAVSAAACRLQQRGFTAASVLMARDKAGGKGKAASSGSAGAAPPPPAAAAGSSVTDGGGSSSEGEEDEEGEDAMADAFERLIGAAFEMVQQGKPLEAEYVLTEGGCCLPGWASGWLGSLELPQVQPAWGRIIQAACCPAPPASAVPSGYT